MHYKRVFPNNMKEDVCREEFVGSELDKTFLTHQKTEASAPENRISEDDPAVPMHLEVLICTAFGTLESSE